MSLCTAIVLTKNETANLERCFASLSWCSEIVVVDSGSIDGTPELAKALGARVLTHVQSGAFNIAEQRNWALDHCGVAPGWILFMDADEAVPRALADQIDKVTMEAVPSFVAYELTPRYLFWGRWLKRTQGYPNWHPRLVRHGQVRFAGGVWEHFDPSVKTGRIHEPYDHFANSKGFSDWLVRHDRYSTWDAQRIYDYLDQSDPAALGTRRKLGLRRLAARWWPFRPVGRFFTMYVLRGGFMEGLPGLAFCCLYAMYEFMTVVKIVELRRIRSGRPL